MVHSSVQYVQQKNLLVALNLKSNVSALMYNAKEFHGSLGSAISE